MSKHTPDEIRFFAQKHAPALAENISALCGDVITKGMVGILEEVCRLQAQRDALLDALQAAELERGRLRADFAELLSCLEIIKQRTTHTTYRIGHDVHRMAEGLLAKHQKGASNGK